VELNALIRSKLRLHRKQLSSDFVSHVSDAIAQEIIQFPDFLNSTHIAYYLADENEINPARIIDRARELKKSLYLPVFSAQNAIAFYPVDATTRFKKNKIGISEPISLEAPIDPKKLDLLLIPLVAFDVQCHRLGRGAGCYDRALQFTLHTPKESRPILIGLAYEFQKLDNIIPQAWDVLMDYVVTENGIYQHASPNQ